MTIENAASVEADDDFDMTADLAAAFDAAEADAPGDIDAAPGADVAGSTAERLRDEATGRFAPKTAAEVAPAATKPADQAAAKEPIAAAAADDGAAAGALAVAGGPPPGWSPTAKAAFAELPADHPIRLAVAQREVEINKGFEKLAEYKPIERFAAMARQSGTTLDKALDRYVTIEQDLGRDFIGGIASICRNQGVDPVALANAIIARNGGSSPQQDGASAVPQAHQRSQQIDPNAIAESVRAQLRAEQDQADVNRSIKEFGGDPKNQFFENVRVEMGRLVAAGSAETIQEAYDKACWANPEIRALLIKKQNPVADASARAAAATQARAASRSITGSPVPGASGRGPETSIEDEVRAAFESSSV